MLEATLLATEQTGAQTIGGADMTTAWTSSRSVVWLDENHLMSSQPCFVSDHPLELPKRPSVKLRPLFGTLPLTAISDASEVFQHNETVWWETIDKAATNGVQISACPTAFLIAQPCPSFFRSRAFALQRASSSTEPFAPLNRLYARNLNTVRSDKQVNLAEVNADNVLWRFIWFGDWNGNGDMQVEFSVSVALENRESRFGSFEDWDVPLPNLDRALHPFAVASSDANPNFIVFQEQSEKSCVQIQRLCFESQRFHGLLFIFDGFVSFRDALTGTDGIISVEVKPLADVLVGQMVQSDGIEATLGNCNLTDGVAGVGKDIHRSFQSLFILCRQVEFTDNGQFHPLNYTDWMRYNSTARGGE